MLWNREDERRLRKLLIKEAPRSYEIFFKRKYLLPNYRQGDYVSQDLENLISFDRLATFASGAAPLKDETWKIALGNTVAGVCYGRPILFLERELGEALLRTDVLENLETGDIKWRWPAFRVYLPRRLVTIDREGETERRYATYFDVSEFGRDGTAFQCPREIAREIDTFCSRHTEFLGQIVHLRGEEPRLLERADFRYKEHAMGIGTALNKSDTIDIVQTIYAQIKPWGLISTTEYKAIGTDLEGSYPQDEADRQFVRKIEHLVLNVLLFMSSAPEAYEPHQVIRTGGLGPKAKSEPDAGTLCRGDGCEDGCRAASSLFHPCGWPQALRSLAGRLLAPPAPWPQRLANQANLDSPLSRGPGTGWTKRQDAGKSGKSMNAEEYHLIRESLGYTQQQLADEIGVDIRTIQRRESEEVPILPEAAIAIYTVIAKRDLNELMAETKSERLRARLKDILQNFETSSEREADDTT